MILNLPIDLPLQVHAIRLFLIRTLKEGLEAGLPIHQLGQIPSQPLLLGHCFLHERGQVEPRVQRILHRLDIGDLSLHPVEHVVEGVLHLVLHALHLALQLI